MRVRVESILSLGCLLGVLVEKLSRQFRYAGMKFYRREGGVCVLGPSGQGGTWRTVVLVPPFLCGSTATCRPGGEMLLAAVASVNALPARPLAPSSAGKKLVARKAV